MGGTPFGTRPREKIYNQTQTLKQLSMKRLPLVSNERDKKGLSMEISGSLDWGRGFTAGTTGGNRFAEKYMALM